MQWDRRFASQDSSIDICTYDQELKEQRWKQNADRTMAMTVQTSRPVQGSVQLTAQGGLTKPGTFPNPGGLRLLKFQYARSICGTGR